MTRFTSQKENFGNKNFAERSDYIAHAHDVSDILLHKTIDDLLLYIHLNQNDPELIFGIVYFNLMNEFTLLDLAVDSGNEDFVYALLHLGLNAEDIWDIEVRNSVEKNWVKLERRYQFRMDRFNK